MATASPPLLLAHPRYSTPGRNRSVDTGAVRRALESVHAHCEAHPDAVETPCLCGADRDAPLVECDRNGLPCPLVLCRACGLIRMNPQPSAASLAWFYDGPYRVIYGPHAPPDELLEKMAWKGELIQSVLDRAEVTLGDGPIVDIGCGAGWALRPLGASGRATIGYDFDDRLLEVGRGAGLDLRRGGVDQALRDDVPAQLLISAHVLEHTTDPVAYLASLRPLVRQDGLLYVEVPHLRRVRELLFGDTLMYWQRAHLWDFQAAHVEVVARRAGWHPVHSDEDSASVYVVCARAEPEPELPMPALGADVEATIAACEAQRSRLPVRMDRAFRRAVQGVKQALRRR